MATRAYSTHAPLLRRSDAAPFLLGQGLGRQLGPVTQAIRAVRAPEPRSAADLAIQAIRAGLAAHFAVTDRRRVRDLRRALADRIEADIALLDALGGDTDLEDSHDRGQENEHGTDDPEAWV